MFLHVIFSRRYLLSPLLYPETRQLSLIDFIVYMLATDMHKTNAKMHNNCKLFLKNLSRQLLFSIFSPA